MSATSFKEAQPHGDLREIFPDVLFVTGTTSPNFNGQQHQFSRNMTVVREGTDLTIINSVRLDEDGLEKLDALGAVVNIVKLGQFHGLDDPFYLDRYKDAKQWGTPRMTHDAGHQSDSELGLSSTPVSDASFFEFKTAKTSEGLLILEREGGIIISCDSLQNWVEVDQYFSDASAEMMTKSGFIKPANIGPGWKMHVQPEASDFERLKKLSFKHLLPAHGAPLEGDAHAQITATIDAFLG